jgi:Tfp pilus assembly protein PilF
MKETPAKPHSSPILRLFAAIPPAVFVWIGAFLVQFLVLNMIAGSRHFLPDGDDMKFYNDWALKLLGQLGWNPGEPNAPGTAYYGLPGYAYALAGIYKMTGGYDHNLSPFLVAQLQAALHALTAVWLFLLGRRVFGGDSQWENRRGTIIGVLAAAAWALFTPAQVFSSILMPTAWVVCAFWGMTYWLVCIHGKGAASWWRPWLWMGLLAGFVAMLVATILMLLPLIVLAIVLLVARGNPLKARILPILGAVAVLMAGVYVGCAPVWIHNYFIAKDRVLLSAHDGLNFYLGNHATSNGYTKIPDGLRASQEGLLKDSLAIPEKAAGHPLKRSEASEFWKKKGRAFISEQPVAWMRLLLRKFENFWNAFQYDDLSILKLLRDENAVPPGLRFGFAAALGLPGLLLCWRRWPRSRWVAGAVLLHMAALMPVFITERYRLAAAPGLLLLGVAGLWLLWENIVARNWKKAAVQVPLTLVCAAFASMPQRDIGLWSLDFYKAGIRSTEGRTEALAQNDPKLAAEYLANARRNLETAYAYVPSNAEIAFALGNVWYYSHDNARAQLCFERAVQISTAAGRPHDGALNNLGVIALSEKRPVNAEAYFQRSLRAEPEDAKTWALLAEARRDKGDLSHAETAIAQAIKFAPRDPALQKFRDELRKPAPPPEAVPK